MLWICATTFLGTAVGQTPIRYRHGEITIIDRDGLVAAACECYQIDHERLRRLL
jgi:hypothetical protein